MEMMTDAQMREMLRVNLSSFSFLHGLADPNWLDAAKVSISAYSGQSVH